MQISPITDQQWLKVAKALAYSFLSGFTGTLLLVSMDFIRAAQTGTTTVVNLGVALLGAALIGGINAVAVAVKQLFTPGE